LGQERSKSRRQENWLSQLRPKTGSWPSDVLFTLGLFFVQDTLLGSIPFAGMQIDLVSPCIIYFCAFRSMGRALCMALVAGYLIETHSATPMGLYFSVYLGLAVILQATRHHLSWHHFTTWIVTVFCTQLVLFLFQFMLLQSYQLEVSSFSLSFWGELGCKFLLSIVIGTILLSQWVQTQKG
jgi:hypothetical protein